jgi:hypothetical protein
MALAMAAVVLAFGLSVWRGQADEKAQRQARMAKCTTLDRARIANQAETALGLIGSVLVNASAHSEKVISDRAVLPLQNSLELTKNKIIRNIEL